MRDLNVDSDSIDVGQSPFQLWSLIAPQTNGSIDIDIMCF